MLDRPVTNLPSVLFRFARGDAICSNDRTPSCIKAIRTLGRVREPSLQLQRRQAVRIFDLPGRTEVRVGYCLRHGRRWATHHLEREGGIAMKAAIYARVSTSNGSQTCENQLLELRRYCDARG